MSPVGRLKIRRVPPGVRRQLEVAGANAWEALVEGHATHALRFISLLAARLDFDDAVSRYLDEMDVRDPMASSIRSRVLVALEGDEGTAGTPRPRSVVQRFRRARGREVNGPDGLRRFRPDVLVRDMARKYRATEASEQEVRLAIARAEEDVIRTHIDNAVVFARLLETHLGLDEAVEEYIELLRIAGGRAQAVYQRTMARLADLYLPRRAHEDPDDAPGRVPRG